MCRRRLVIGPWTTASALSHRLLRPEKSKKYCEPLFILPPPPPLPPSSPRLLTMPGISINTEPSSTRPASPQRTNTLVITSLPAPFFHPLVMQALRDHFEIFGMIYAWAPLRAFARIIVVFYDEENAEDAKVNCDGLQVDATVETCVFFSSSLPIPFADLHTSLSDEFVIRVYRGDPTPIESVPTQPREGPDPHYLYPPAIEKNFLISPPGSPPVGWEPIKEEPPNVTPLADDLIAALRKLQLVERQIVGPQVLVEPEEGAGIGVYVEDCDAGPEFGDMDGEGDWMYGDDNPSRMTWRPTPTALPPMSCAAA
ncbi:hypothetical protein EVG20_g11032 [Dentipellis fragilis]|uniref:Calcipressin n=1 Tax=Dentipellis fragilis TaxID=205917 RepID=A0A4Y9XNP2_9AGAM|nr:hypothetical protein EVG20_g11032 [Dentipellis fragilis]